MDLGLPDQRHPLGIGGHVADDRPHLLGARVELLRALSADHDRQPYAATITGRAPPPAHPRLDRLHRHPGARHRRSASDDLELVGLSAERSVGAAGRAGPRARRRRGSRSPTPTRARAPPRRGPTARCSSAPRGSCGSCSSPEPDLVLNALVGSAGLGPTVATLGEGIDLALANKESLVVGGELVMQLAEATGARIIPVDSEHSALHQLIAGERPGTRREARADRQSAARSAAARAPSSRTSRSSRRWRHPTWAMGGKITIDSATLMNKGLEVIEAHHLFGVPYDRIDVVVHPQSIVHSYVTLCDGAALAHLGHPDMRVPIAYALHHPERVDVPVPAARPRRGRRADLRARRRRGVPVPAPGARGGEWRAAPRPACSTPPTRSPSTPSCSGRLGFLGIAGGDRGDARPAARRRPSARSSRSTRPTARRGRPPRPSWCAQARGVPPRELVPRLRRLRRPDHPPRVRPLPRGEGRRHARRALHAVLPADPGEGPAGRDGVRRSAPIPLGRLREDHRDEPQRGAPARTSPTAPTTASRCGSGSW